MISGNTSRAAVFGLALILAACGKHPSTGETSGATTTTTAATSAAPVAPAPTLANQKPGETASTESSTITRVNEDGSETVEDTSSDNSARNLLLAAVASTAAATTTSAPSLWQEGVNYTRLVPAQPTAVPAGQVEVLEFFWYACPHCYALDPLIESWKKTKAPYISFSRVPVMWNDGHRSLARLYYTLDSLGKLNELHAAVFKEIHVNGNPLTDVANDDRKSEQIQTAFVTKLGVSAEAFKSAYRSFAVETAMQRADQLWQRYRISAVPMFVVNGKFIADVGTAQSEERLIALINDLAAIEHKR